jgi:hypothetical protein
MSLEAFRVELSVGIDWSTLVASGESKHVEESACLTAELGVVASTTVKSPTYRTPTLAENGRLNNRHKPSGVRLTLI